MTASPRRLAAVLVAGTLMVLATGCTTYSAKLKDLRPEIAAGSYDEALLTVEKETGSKDVLLAFLERGVILHRAGRYQESNEAFAAAERTAEELYARSISEGALSLISNDNAISYRARPFEMAMVPYFRALNYLHLGLRDDAMVEARKTSLMLSKYIDATIAGIERGDTDQLARTKNDPFMLYFSGMLYDWDGELNDAFIAYRNAATAYQDVSRLLGLEIPPSLGWDLERVSRRLGFGAELAQLRTVCPDVFAAAGPAPAAPPQSGEVVLLVELGWVAAKHEERLDLPIFESDAYNDNAYWAWELTARAGTTYAIIDGYKIKYWLTVAVPAMETRPAATRRVRVRTAALPGAAVGSRVHQPSRNAAITFEAEYGTILFKTILRGLTKYLATQEANKQNEVVGFLTNLLGVATETADTRSWLLLPDHVQLVRLQLPAGVHDLELELLDGSGRPRGTVTIPGVTVRTGDWTFINQRIYPR